MKIGGTYLGFFQCNFWHANFKLEKTKFSRFTRLKVDLTVFLSEHKSFVWCLHALLTQSYFAAVSLLSALSYMMYSVNSPEKKS